MTKRKSIKASLVLLLAGAIAVGISGCSTYKPRADGFGKMGYEEQKLDDDTYILSYYGSSMDDEKDVREKWNKRASELCGGEKYQADTSEKEWSYDGYTIIPPLLLKTKASSPLIEGKLSCN